MRGLSVIIPSRTASNLVPCLREIASIDPGHRVIVVDDGLDLADLAWEQRIPETALVRGHKPFIFARNANIGITAAGGDDVVLLNDDALLRSFGGFSAMQRVASENPEFGVISSTTNVAGNLDQNPRRGGGLRDAGANSVAFVCVLIPRKTIELIGMLDERFVAYGWEDNDYNRRVRMAGLKVGIFDGCFVDHGCMRSTFRGAPWTPGDVAAGAAIYQQKWGDLN